MRCNKGIEHTTCTDTACHYYRTGPVRCRKHGMLSDIVNWTILAAASTYTSTAFPPDIF